MKERIILVMVFALTVVAGDYLVRANVVHRLGRFQPVGTSNYAVDTTNGKLCQSFNAKGEAIPMCSDLK